MLYIPPSILLFATVVIFAILARALYVRYIPEGAYESNLRYDETYCYRQVKSRRLPPEDCPACNAHGKMQRVDAYRTSVGQGYRPEGQTEELVNPIKEDEGYQCSNCERFFSRFAPPLP